MLKYHMTVYTVMILVQSILYTKLEQACTFLQSDQEQLPGSIYSTVIISFPIDAL